MKSAKVPKIGTWHLVIFVFFFESIRLAIT
jgi:hypothetical protein